MQVLIFGILLATGADLGHDWARLRPAQPEGYVCGRGQGIVVDGKLDEKSWTEAPWTRDFRDIEGVSRPKPRFRTRAKMLWDDTYFYIAAELEEPHVWGTLTNHDAVIFQDPDFEVFIDPDGDRHNYYEFEMNALNTGWDLLLKKPYIDGGPALNEWEIPGLKTAVHVKGTLNNTTDKDTGWTLEIAFPWRVLREFSRQAAPPKEGDVWRVDFSRVEWQIETSGNHYKKVAGTKEDNWIWSPPGIIDMHRPENWGYVKFTSQTGSQETFHPKRDPATDQVLDVYYAQKEFQQKNKRWASTLEELGNPGSFTGVTLRKTANGYEASAGARKIREDGLLQ